eukprot:gene29151-32374_t
MHSRHPDRVHSFRPDETTGAWDASQEIRIHPYARCDGGSSSGLVAALHMAETMRVLVGVGIVLESRRRCGAMVSTETRFVDINNIEAIIINEGLTTTNVYYYLALMIKQPKMHSGDEQGALVIPFKNLMPRLHILQEVYVEVHNLLLQREHDSAQR